MTLFIVRHAAPLAMLAAGLQGLGRGLSEVSYADLSSEGAARRTHVVCAAMNLSMMVMWFGAFAFVCSPLRAHLHAPPATLSDFRWAMRVSIPVVTCVCCMPAALLDHVADPSMVPSIAYLYANPISTGIFISGVLHENGEVSPSGGRGGGGGMLPFPRSSRTPELCATHRRPSAGARPAPKLSRPSVGFNPPPLVRARTLIGSISTTYPRQHILTTFWATSLVSHTAVRPNTRRSAWARARGPEPRYIVPLCLDPPCLSLHPSSPTHEPRPPARCPHVTYVRPPSR